MLLEVLDVHGASRISRLQVPTERLQVDGERFEVLGPYAFHIDLARLHQERLKVLGGLIRVRLVSLRGGCRIPKQPTKSFVKTLDGTGHHLANIYVCVEPPRLDDRLVDEMVEWGAEQLGHQILGQLWDRVPVGLRLALSPELGHGIVGEEALAKALMKLGHVSDQRSELREALAGLIIGHQDV